MSKKPSDGVMAQEEAIQECQSTAKDIATMIYVAAGAAEQMNAEVANSLYSVGARVLDWAETLGGRRLRLLSRINGINLGSSLIGLAASLQWLDANATAPGMPKATKRIEQLVEKLQRESAELDMLIGGGRPQPKGEGWSAPMPLTAICDRVYGNTSQTRLLKKAYSRDLHKITSKSWQIRLEALPKDKQEKFKRP